VTGPDGRLCLYFKSKEQCKKAAVWARAHKLSQLRAHLKDNCKYPACVDASARLKEEEAEAATRRRLLKMKEGTSTDGDREGKREGKTATESITTTEGSETKHTAAAAANPNSGDVGETSLTLYPDCTGDDRHDKHVTAAAPPVKPPSGDAATPPAHEVMHMLEVVQDAEFVEGIAHVEGKTAARGGEKAEGKVEGKVEEKAEGKAAGKAASGLLRKIKSVKVAIGAAKMLEGKAEGGGVRRRGRSPRSNASL
jgi:hypothetical protein